MDGARKRTRETGRNACGRRCKACGQTERKSHASADFTRACVTRRRITTVPLDFMKPSVIPLCESGNALLVARMTSFEILVNHHLELCCLRAKTRVLGGQKATSRSAGGHLAFSQTWIKRESTLSRPFLRYDVQRKATIIPARSAKQWIDRWKIRAVVLVNDVVAIFIREMPRHSSHGIVNSLLAPRNHPIHARISCSTVTKRNECSSTILGYLNYIVPNIQHISFPWDRSASRRPSLYRAARDSL